jgi:uncharacterized membrane protein YphA (DoxX/SURF4 family)
VSAFIVATAKLTGAPIDAPLWIGITSGVLGALLLIGLWTPFAASGQAIIETLLAFTVAAFDWTHLIFALIALSLVMLGPGSWSIDARLYGRKRIDLGRPRRDRDS